MRSVALMVLASVSMVGLVACTSTSGERKKNSSDLENTYFGEVDDSPGGDEWLTSGDVGPLPLD